MDHREQQIPDKDLKHRYRGYILVAENKWNEPAGKQRPAGTQRQRDNENPLLHHIKPLCQFCGVIRVETGRGREQNDAKDTIEHQEKEDHFARGAEDSDIRVCHEQSDHDRGEVNAEMRKNCATAKGYGMAHQAFPVQG